MSGRHAVPHPPAPADHVPPAPWQSRPTPPLATALIALGALLVASPLLTALLPVPRLPGWPSLLGPPLLLLGQHLNWRARAGEGREADPLWPLLTGQASRTLLSWSAWMVGAAWIAVGPWSLGEDDAHELTGFGATMGLTLLLAPIPGLTAALRRHRRRPLPRPLPVALPPQRPAAFRQARVSPEGGLQLTWHDRGVRTVQAAGLIIPLAQRGGDWVQQLEHAARWRQTGGNNSVTIHHLPLWRLDDSACPTLLIEHTHGEWTDGTQRFTPLRDALVRWGYAQPTGDHGLPALPSVHGPALQGFALTLAVVALWLPMLLGAVGSALFLARLPDVPAAVTRERCEQAAAGRAQAEGLRVHEVTFTAQGAERSGRGHLYVSGWVQGGEGWSRRLISAQCQVQEGSGAATLPVWLDATDRWTPQERR
ncbi:hypothetical protein F8S09_15225 [Deinococcus sp. SDU3-2]|uniref:Uncharacterized protein n=1 Tax=Deinococcus terrestris TaxID=2651870 RepID=A0A7X1NZ67_9DEIO|nr:hypothetical protein [Deinococcus terrestris]MPY68009.1 hypothetical protein [Deinococcus terrestris]